MLKTLLTVTYYLLYAISFLVFIRAIASFFGSARFSKYYEILVRLTEPFLSPLRKLISWLSKGRPMMFDFSFIALYIIIMILQRIIMMIQAGL
ncbi:MAG TPA: YggT family protein [Clostridia bacterium]|nr:YggT family protein [Clostridia bacterium]